MIQTFISTSVRHSSGHSTFRKALLCFLCCVPCSGPSRPTSQLCSCTDHRTPCSGSCILTQQQCTGNSAHSDSGPFSLWLRSLVTLKPSLGILRPPESAVSRDGGKSCHKEKHGISERLPFLLLHKNFCCLPTLRPFLFPAHKSMRKIDFFFVTWLVKFLVTLLSQLLNSKRPYPMKLKVSSN